MPPRHARIVLISSQQRVALIRRRRGGQEYWSFPGGGIKRGERPQHAARREVLEELGLDVRPERLLAVASGHVLYLAAIDSEPALRMRGPEVARRSRRDRYQPAWVSLDQLTELDLRPRTAYVALGSLIRARQSAATEPDAPPRHEPAGKAPDKPVQPTGEPRSTAGTEATALGQDAGRDGRAPASTRPDDGRTGPSRGPRRWALVWRRWIGARRRRTAADLPADSQPSGML